jgi:hypothetical protein
MSKYQNHKFKCQRTSQIFDRNGNGSITCGMIDLISKTDISEVSIEI